MRPGPALSRVFLYRKKSFASVGINVKAIKTELINVIATTIAKMSLYFPESPPTKPIGKKTRIVVSAEAIIADETFFVYSISAAKEESSLYYFSNYATD